MEKWFGNVINGDMRLSEIGRIALKMWCEIPLHFPFIVGSLHATTLPLSVQTSLKNATMSSISPKSGSLSVVIRSYKSVVTKYAHKVDSGFSWQSGFYDTIICTTGQLSRIRKYILNNPKNWDKKECYQ
ncbi:MAG: hypothetical protein Q7J06_04435 [Bacteroidales bacterium]|nr:hypothetical protein [Bacteroidales bacterium]